MRPHRAERVERKVELALNGTAGRLAIDVVDRTADCVKSGHQGGGALQELDLREVGRVHRARRDALWASRDAVVEDVHLAETEAAHREAGGGAGSIDRQHADGAVRGL